VQNDCISPKEFCFFAFRFPYFDVAMNALLLCKVQMYNSGGALVKRDGGKGLVWRRFEFDLTVDHGS
jgi:hypothetical protein